MVGMLPQKSRLFQYDCSRILRINSSHLCRSLGMDGWFRSSNPRGDSMFMRTPLKTALIKGGSMRCKFGLCLLTICWLVFAVTAAAQQNTGTILGIVKDS